MKQTLRLFLVLLGALAQKGLSAGETVNASAGTAFPSVQEAGSARAVALGSTYVGIAEGSATLPWNPAGLAAVAGKELSVHHNSTVAGSFQETAIFAMPLNHDNGLGLSANYGDSGDFEGRDDAGNLTSNYSARAYGATLGWGMRPMTDVAFGAALKVNSQDLAGSAFTAVAGDLGALWTPTPSFSIGAAYTNLGPDVAGLPLAQGLSLGVSSYLWKGSDFQLLLALSGESLLHSDDAVHFGVENRLFKMLALRVGYACNIPSQPNSDALLGWTLGGGVQLAGLSLDYAYIPLAEIGNVQRVSLTYAFGDKTSK
jgi:hypothetical protein